MRALELRPYQAASIEGLRDGIRAGHKRQIMCAPTGAGKSVCAAFLIQEALNKFSKTYFIVDRLALLDQASSLFDSYEIPHGVIQAGHWRWRPYERLQVCSAATLARRGLGEDLKLALIDECHIQSRTITAFIEKHPDLVVIGLSATPFTKALGKVYSRVVSVTTTDKLIAEGWLVPVHQYVATTVDMAGAKLKSTGEWEEAEMEKRGMTIVGDVVGEWEKRTLDTFGGPVKTICFSATVAHGEELCRQWQDAGYNFQQISYKDTNDEKRRAIIEEFRREDSSIVGLVSCEALSRGFDVTDIKFGVFCRPYRKSLSGWIQQLGRIMRPHAGKEFAIAHDHAGNALRFLRDTEEVFRDGVNDLDDGKRDSLARKEPNTRQKEARLCSCGYLLPPNAVRCPACGKERLGKLSLVETVAGEMVSLSRGDAPKVPEYLRDRDAVWRQLCHHALERKRGDEEKARKFALAQYRNLFGGWPMGEFSATDIEVPHPQLVRKIQQGIIAWAKRRAA